MQLIIKHFKTKLYSIYITYDFFLNDNTSKSASLYTKRINITVTKKPTVT